ncbi:MAG: DNRLRE domain-containing protein [Candidatus Fermentibacteraceae bacterium]|nr:DNRLRE domain-containing protein [Candidatus Fermentibacteraceae bacterium]MBN2608389.1 DNRLRE domain-containing protein [Candidatus Fermentibacteraceae bacterium]
MKYKSTVLVLILAVTGLEASETIILPPTADTHVWEFAPDINYGASDNMTVGYLYGWSNALIKFDLSPLAGTTIIDATLWLNCWDLLGSVPAEDIFIGRNDAVWAESGVTWNNKPDFVDVVSVPAPLETGYWLVCVTGFVQEFVNGTWPDYGFQIYMDNTNDDAFCLRSKEGPPVVSPFLCVEYDPLALESTTFGAIKAMFR